MTTSALTEKTEVVIKGLVDPSERKRAAGLRPALTAPAPAAAPAQAPARTSPAIPNPTPSAGTTRSEGTVVTVPIQMLVEAPRSPDEVIDRLLGPEIREKYPIHLGFYLKPAHKEMIEEINENLHRGRSPIVRRAIEHLYFSLMKRGLLGDSSAAGGRGKGKGRDAEG
jgi:hypothetical protein